MTCLVPGIGVIVRFTRVSGCCAPIPGANNAVVTNGFASIESSANTEETEGLQKRLADGSLCINRPARSYLANYEITIDACPINIDAFEIMTGQPPIVDYAGNAIGWRGNENSFSLDGWGLEVWITEDFGDECDPSGEGRYIYMLYPCLQNATMGDITIEDGSTIDFTFTATTKQGAAWCRGPYNVVEQSEGDTVGGQLIDPLLPGDHMIAFVTNIPPPEPNCEAVAVPAVDLGCSDSPTSP